MLQRYLMPGLLVAVLGLAGTALWYQRANAALNMRNDALETRLSDMTAALEQAREAARIADAHRKAEAARADKLNASIEALVSEDFDNADVEIDPRITELLDCLRRGADGVSCAGGSQ